MFINIVKRMEQKQYIYTVNQDNRFCAKANYTYNILPRKIQVFYNNESRFVFKQKRWYIKLFVFFLMLQSFPKYILYQNNYRVGESRIKFFSPRREIKIKEDLYELYLHSNNYISIMKNDIQIALVKRNIISNFGQCDYQVLFNKNEFDDLSELTLLVAYLDLIFFHHRNKIYAIKYEKTCGIDRHENRKLWKPQGEV